jgi:hypothetical protein
VFVRVSSSPFDSAHFAADKETGLLDGVKC